MAIALRRFVAAVTVCAAALPPSLNPSRAAVAFSEGGAGRSMAAQSPTYGVGRPPTAAELGAIDIEVLPDGTGLPPGSGSAAIGKDVYTRRCETCHGPTGKEGPQDVVAGGRGSLGTARPQKTVGSYWPYATTLWDYVNRAMPFDHPGTMTADDVYAATAYVLFLNGIVDEHDVLDRTTLPQVKMPNRNGFVVDPRPDVGLKPAGEPPQTTPRKKSSHQD
jgi:S-disulfanyl-L-cysteine oxidoreductase SoxD